MTSEELTFHILEAGVYHIRTHSVSFPRLTSADLVGFLIQARHTGTTAVVAQFRDWVRQVLLNRLD